MNRSSHPAPDGADARAHGNLAAAAGFVAGLAAAGVRHAVVSPGSRATPLTLALLRRPEITVHVVIDERSAAFVALGLGKASGMPAALVGTSGSAPANWYPAVIEADADDVPLLLLSADRPPEALGWGANQTVLQHELFARHARACHSAGLPQAGADEARARGLLALRAVLETRSPRPGPVQVNLPFAEPVLPAEVPADAGPPPLPAVRTAPARPMPDAAAIAGLAARLAGRPGLIVCGGLPAPLAPPAFADHLARLAERLAAPILADPLSGVRFGAAARGLLCTRQEARLRDPETPRPDWVLRFGAWPVSRSVGDWLAGGDGTWHALVVLPGRWPDPARQADCLIQGEPETVCAALLDALGPLPPAGAAAHARCAAWLAGERAAGAHADAAVAGAVAADATWEPALIATLCARLPAGHGLFCGNSMAIRDLDGFSGSGARRLAVFGNRGASGIDGNLSTAAGIARAHGPTVALLGDVGLAHDLNALAALREIDLVAIVLNNGGGGIFDYLAEARLPRALFETAWLTPPAVDFVGAASAFGIPARRVASHSAFLAALDDALSRRGPSLIDVRIDRAASLARHRAYWNTVRARSG